MIRVVRLPEGAVVIDEGGRVSGRGAYVCPEPECVTLCLKKRLLEKSLKCVIPELVKVRLKELGHVPEGVTDLEESVLKKEIFSTLSLARKSGELLIGQDRVLESLDAGNVLSVLLSNDHSENLLRSLELRSATLYVLKDTGRLELGHLLGLRQAQVVALPAKSGFAENLKDLLSEEGGNAIE